MREQQKEGKSFAFVARNSANFDERYRDVVENDGAVNPDIATTKFPIVKISKHPFKGTGKNAIEAAREWASKNLVGEHIAHRGTPEEFKYVIETNNEGYDDPIGKMLSSSSTKKSENLGLHISTLMNLVEIIDKSKECFYYAGKRKIEGERDKGNALEQNPTIMHVMYAAVKLEGEEQLRRARILIKEIKGDENEPYTFIVEKVDLPQRGPSADDALSKSTFISGTNLLSDIDISKYTSKKLLGSNDLNDIENSSSDIYTTPTPQEDVANITNNSEVIPTEDVDKGIYINVANQDYIEQILNGDKTIETRFEIKGKDGKGPLDSLVGKRVALIATGNGKQKVMGYVTIADKKLYENEDAFRADENQHKVSGGEYDVANGNGRRKIGYVLENPVREETPYETEGNSGHTIRNSHIGANGSKTFSHVTPEQDKDYLDAVEKGDTKAAERMVRDAAAKAMPEMATLRSVRSKRRCSPLFPTRLV